MTSRKVVVFPQPLGPSSVSTSPSRTSSDTPSTACSEPNVFETSIKRRTGSIGRASAPFITPQPRPQAERAGEQRRPKRQQEDDDADDRRRLEETGVEVFE